MTKKITVGLVGARGYVGREMMRLIEADPAFELVLASSREHAGKPIQHLDPSLQTELSFVNSEPEAIAAAGCDALVLGLPNGLAAPYVASIESQAPETVLVDLSADYRHQPGWTFGITDLQPSDIKGQKRIANPGCYATAGILALYPIRDLLSGAPSVFGLSGYSGAGTKKGPKNDPARLKNNVLPYGFDGHGHQEEIS
ncbi:MAG: N-acetyl-gamma-glutamyl-phosphate reductase, partial [Pseudomonadota bacterium]